MKKVLFLLALVAIASVTTIFAQQRQPDLDRQQHTGNPVPCAPSFSTLPVSSLTSPIYVITNVNSNNGMNAGYVPNRYYGFKRRHTNSGVKKDKCCCGVATDTVNKKTAGVDTTTKSVPGLPKDTPGSVPTGGNPKDLLQALVILLLVVGILTALLMLLQHYLRRRNAPISPVVSPASPVSPAPAQPSPVSPVIDAKDAMEKVSKTGGSFSTRADGSWKADFKPMVDITSQTSVKEDVKAADVPK